MDVYWTPAVKTLHKRFLLGTLGTAPHVVKSGWACRRHTWWLTLLYRARSASEYSTDIGHGCGAGSSPSMQPCTILVELGSSWAIINSWELDRTCKKVEFITGDGNFFSQSCECAVRLAAMGGIIYLSMPPSLLRPRASKKRAASAKVSGTCRLFQTSLPAAWQVQYQNISSAGKAVLGPRFKSFRRPS